MSREESTTQIAAEFESFFESRGEKRTPYGHQVRVAEHVLAGRNVILQAPTGAGKTEAALFPYLYARKHMSLFPRRLIYAVPMRVLAKAFANRLNDYPNLGASGQVLTGDQPEAPRFEADLVFATIDQVLSSFLVVPYSLSRRQGNLNAGALGSSFLVFDEFHLLDPDASLPTTLLLLQMLRGYTPFLLMTATFSSALLERLANLLDAEVVCVSPEAAAAMPSQQKVRRFHRVDRPLTAQEVIAQHKLGDISRSIVVCNTVEKAQELYADLHESVKSLPNGSRPQVLLLHSRFYQEDRRDKELSVQRNFRRLLPSEQREQINAIIVATQVIEVGLDITSDVLHTEVAPMSALVQRAGRCARYEGEEGDVYIYRVESFAPYNELADLCRGTWEALAAVNGKAVDFGHEQEIISLVHNEHDRRMLDALRSRSAEHLRKMQDTMDSQDFDNLQYLIRQDDSRRLFVHPAPNADVNPYTQETVSFYRGSLLAQWKEWEKEGAEHLPWLLRYPREETETETETDRQRLVFRWEEVKNIGDLAKHVIFAVSPGVVAYDSTLGFRFQSAGNAPPSPALNQRQRSEISYSYQRETYAEHIGRMVAALDRVYEREFSWSGRQMGMALELAPSSVEQALRFAIACHDAGKLTVRWQRWAHEYQQRIGEPVPDNMILAHTHFDESNLLHRDVQKELGRKPYHAAEGLAIVAKLAESLVPDERVGIAALSAIARHHSPSASEVHEDVLLHPEARNALAMALAQAGLPVSAAAIPPPLRWKKPRLAVAAEIDTFLIYLLVVRVLRLVDQAAMERV